MSSMTGNSDPGDDTRAAYIGNRSALASLLAISAGVLWRFAAPYLLPMTVVIVVIYVLGEVISARRRRFMPRDPDWPSTQQSDSDSDVFH